MTATSVTRAIELLDRSASGRGGHLIPVTGMPSRKASIEVEPSATGHSRVFIRLRDQDVGGSAAHMTNEEAMALGLALIRCATEVREN